MEPNLYVNALLAGRERVRVSPRTHDLCKGVPSLRPWIAGVITDSEAEQVWSRVSALHSFVGL
jgi:hypothetical protein